MDDFVEAYSARQTPTGAVSATPDSDHASDPASLRHTVRSAKMAYYTVVALFSLLVLPPVAFCLLTRGRARRAAGAGYSSLPLLSSDPRKQQLQQLFTGKDCCFLIVLTLVMLNACKVVYFLALQYILAMY